MSTKKKAKKATKKKTKSLGKSKVTRSRVMRPVPKKGTVSIAKVRKAVCKIEQISEPKSGDAASLAFHYAGLVSWEEVNLDKVAKGREVLWVDGQLYEKKDDGTYVYEDYTLGPCKKVIHLDAGKSARAYKEN